MASSSNHRSCTGHSGRSRGYSAVLTSQQQQQQQQQRSKKPYSDSDRSYRSRSISRSSADGPTASAAPIKRRDDLDAEREGRLRRALSFSGRGRKNPGDSGGSENRTTNGKATTNGGGTNGIIGSVRSLYATITKGTKKKGGHVSS